MAPLMVQGVLNPSSEDAVTSRTSALVRGPSIVKLKTA
jgi:hypothetical protein